jgi:hypothetical protein
VEEIGTDALHCTMCNEPAADEPGIIQTTWETPARAFARDLNVVVVAATTKECRRCGNDDKRTREGSVPPATAAAAVTAVTRVLAGLLDDHGTTAPGQSACPGS